MTQTPACAHCGSRVTPTPEGYCPACVQPFRPATEGQTAFEGQSFDAKHDSSHHGLVKLALILFVVPVVAQLASMGFSLLFSPPLYLLPMETQLAMLPTLGNIASILGLACGIIAAWKYWPKS